MTAKATGTEVRLPCLLFLGRVGQKSVGIRKKTWGGRQRGKCKEFYSIQLRLSQEVTESRFEKHDTLSHQQVLEKMDGGPFCLGQACLGGQG